MPVNRLSCFMFVLVVFVLFGSIAHVPQVDATSSALQPAPTITMRLAVSDAQGTPSETAVLELIEQVRERSDGSIVIEPDWQAGAETEAGFEQGVVAAASPLCPSTLKRLQYECNMNVAMPSSFK